MQDGSEEVPSLGRRSRPRSNGFVVAVAVLVVASLGVGLTAALTLGGADSTTAPAALHEVALPRPHTIVRDGTTYTIGPTSAVAVAADGNAHSNLITIYMFSQMQHGRPECSFLEPTTRIERETSKSVRVATFDYRARTSAATGTINCAYLSAGTPRPPYKAMTLQLKEPLGSRLVIDERTGKAIGTLDPAYSPTPRYLPAGYSETLIQHFTPTDSFIALHQYRNRAEHTALEVRIRSVTAWIRSGRVITRTSVRGAPATVTEETYERCVSWFPRPGLVAEVCSLSHMFLEPEELIRIANSIPAIP